MESVSVTMTPCMPGGGRHWGMKGRACEKCPRVLGKFRCGHRCHNGKRVLIRRKKNST